MTRVLVDVGIVLALNRDEFAERTGVTLPDGPDETAAGYVMSRLGALPKVGDEVEVDGRRVTVSELDGRRVARLKVSSTAESTGSGADAGADDNS